MRTFQFRTFLIISVIFHFIVIATIGIFLLSRKDDEKPEPTQISFGIISQNNGAIGNARNNSKQLVNQNSKIERGLRPKKSNVIDPDSVEQKAKSILMANTEMERESLKSNDLNELINIKQNKTKIENGSLSTSKGQTESYTDENKFADVGGGSNYKPNGGITSKSSGQDLEIAHPDYKVNPKPKYPMVARRKGYEGSVLLRVWVVESGDVGKIELEKSSGFDVLDNSALDAVKDWVFIPGMRNGVPISSWVTVPIKFQLSSG